MLQGLGAISSFDRFLSFATLTAALAMLGVFVGRKMGADKSARTFLGLAAAATPVLFSQLGAMILSITTNAAAPVPQMFVITAPTLSAAGIAALITSLVMTPVLYIGFAAMFRAHAKHLVLLMLACSAMLLIPTRAPNAAALMIAAQTTMIAAYMLRTRARAPGEIESMVAGTLPLLPIIILMTRQFFYGGSNLFAASVSAFVAFAFLVAHPFTSPQSSRPDHGRTLGILSLMCTWFFLASEVTHYLQVQSEFQFMITVYPAVIAALLFIRQSAPIARTLLTILATIVPLLTICWAWSFSASLASIYIGLVVSMLGYVRRDISVMGSGVLATASGLTFFGIQSLKLFQQAPWISLALLGTAAILLAAWLERNRHQLAKWKERVDAHFTSGHNTHQRPGEDF